MNLKSWAEWLRNVPVLIAVAVISFVCLLQALPHLFRGFSLFERLEAMSYDWRLGMAQHVPYPVVPDLGVVFIDDDSLQAVNANFQFAWPWPRQLHGRLVSELTAQGARVIGFDILCPELHPLSAETALLISNRVVSSDDYFAEQMRQAGNLVLAASGEMVSNRWHVLLPAEKFRTNAWQVGHIMSDADADGVLRRARVYYDDPAHGRFWHMGILLAARYLDLDMDQADVRPGRVTLHGRNGATRVIPTSRDGFFYIDWSLQWNDRRIAKEHFEKLLQQEMARANGKTNTQPAWRNKIVVVGAIASGNNISDVGATPLSNKTYLVSKHWNVANAIILNRFIHRSADLLETCLIVFMGTLSAIITWRFRALRASLLVAAVLVAYFALGVWLFLASRYWLPLILPGTVALLMSHVCLVTYRVVVEQRERHRIRSVFSRVVSPDVVNELLQAKTIALGGARCRVTVYFADIRGFTRVTDDSQVRAEAYVKSRALPPREAEIYLEQQAREILATVNLYLGLVADTIKNRRGTFDKYIGDCVMAFWGAPTPNDRHAVDCVHAAIDAQRAIYALNLSRAEENKRRERANSERLAAGQPPLPPLTLLALGSGVNTGAVTVGLMGSDAHILNYTIFGREVNLASRLEGISGRGRVLISGSTFAELQRLEPALAAICAPLPPVTVKGIRERLTVYDVQWRKLDAETQAYDTGILTGAGFTPPTDFHPPEEG